MENHIKCSYKTCKEHFDSVDAMRKHKTHDKVHGFYCKKCDADIVDDSELLLHQITSEKHICCPVCGKEFKSCGGRDRHLGLTHRSLQTIRCPGCSKIFTAASHMMKHIENDECHSITSEDFYKQRAEKQIEKDAWTAALDPLNGSTTVHTVSDETENGRVSLLDNERAHVVRDWQGHAVSYRSELERDSTWSGVTQVPNMNLKQFPALHTTTTSTASIQDSNNSGVNLHRHEVSLSNDLYAATRQEWSFDRAPPPSSLEKGSTDLLGSTIEDHSQSTSKAHTRKHNNENHTPAPRPTHQGTASPFAQLQTGSLMRLPNRLEINRLWNPIEEVYVCPGQKCDGRYTSVQSFETHLFVHHITGIAQCPGCMRRFKTTTALVAHCESPSFKCKIRNSYDYDLILQEITAGLIGIDGRLDDGNIKYTSRPLEEW